MKKKIVLAILAVLAACLVTGCHFRKTEEPETETASSVENLSTEETVKPETMPDPLKAESIIEDASAPIEEETEDEYVPGPPSQEAENQEQTPSRPEETPSQEQHSVTPEFKAMIDANEAFFSEYCDFLLEYSSQGAPESMAAAAERMQEDYVSTLAELNAINQSSLSSADLEYYQNAMERIQNKIASIPG